MKRQLGLLWDVINYLRIITMPPKHDIFGGEKKGSGKEEADKSRDVEYLVARLEERHRREDEAAGGPSSSEFDELDLSSVENRNAKLRYEEALAAQTRNRPKKSDKTLAEAREHAENPFEKISTKVKKNEIQVVPPQRAEDVARGFIANNRKNPNIMGLLQEKRGSIANIMGDEFADAFEESVIALKNNEIERSMLRDDLGKIEKRYPDPSFKEAITVIRKRVDLLEEENPLVSVEDVVSLLESDPDLGSYIQLVHNELRHAKEDRKPKSSHSRGLESAGGPDSQVAA